MRGKSLNNIFASCLRILCNEFWSYFPTTIPPNAPSSTHHISYPFIFKSQLNPICAGHILTDLPVATLVKKSDSTSPRSHHLPVFRQSGNLHTRMLSGFILCESCAENYSCCVFAHDPVMSRSYVSFGFHLTFWFLQLFCSLFLNSP